MGFLATPLDHALSSTSKIRLLRLLVEQDRTVSAREAARLTGMSRTAILAAIEDLTALGLVEREESGHQFLCRANHDHILLQLALGPLFAAEAEWTERFFMAVRGILGPEAPLKSEVLGAWIFGSVARGRDKPGSDVDLFVLTASDAAGKRVAERMSDHLSGWRRHFGADVRPIVMSVARAAKERRSGNPLLTNAMRDARIVLGKIPKELQRGETHDDAPRGQGGGL